MSHVAEQRFAGRFPEGGRSVPPGPYLVVGLGVAGIAATHALADRYGSSSVRACDASNPRWMSDELERLRKRGVAVWTIATAWTRFRRRPAAVASSRAPGSRSTLRY